VPYTPVSHPFVERLIGTIRREYLDRMFFWNVLDLTRKVAEFRDYYNAHRVHRALAGSTPVQRAGALSPAPAALDQLRLAAPLPRSVPDADRGVTINSPPAAGEPVHSSLTSARAQCTDGGASARRRARNQPPPTLRAQNMSYAPKRSEVVLLNPASLTIDDRTPRKFLGPKL
jgi:hypothetical protein